MKQPKNALAQWGKAHPKLRGLLLAAIILLAAAMVTSVRHTWSKYYTGSWDGYSELTAVGRIIQVQQGWSSSGGFLGVYTEEWGDGEGYMMLKEPPAISDNDGYKPYTHQSGLQGTLFGLLARALRGINGETRLNALYFVNSTLFYALAFALCLGLTARFGGLAGMLAMVSIVFSPWLTMGVKNLYWVLWTWLLPCAAGMALCAAHRATGKFSLRWHALCFAAVFVRCLCGFEYLSTLLILMEIPLVLEWAASPRERRGWFGQMFLAGVTGVSGAAAALLVWLVQCWLWFRDFSMAVECVLGTALARVGVEGAGVEVIELEQELSRLGVVRMFLTEGAPLVEIGGIGLGLPALLAAALAAMAVIFALNRKTPARWLMAGALWLLSAAAPISWMLLAKEHSALHAHLTPMLWYFSLVPVCAALVGCAAEQLLRRMAKR